MDTVLAEKVLHLELSVPHSVSIAAGEAQVFTPYCSPRACCHIRPRRERRSSRQPTGGLSLWGERRWTEEPTCQLHTCLEGKAIEEIGYFLEWVGGDHHDEICGFSGRGFDTPGFFLFRLPCSRLRGCSGLGLRILVPAFFLVAVTFGCLGTSVAG